MIFSVAICHCKAISVFVWRSCRNLVWLCKIHIVSELEDSSGSCTTCELKDRVKECLIEEATIQCLSRSNAKRHRWVEGAARDTSNCTATNCHARANGKAKHVGGLGALRHSHGEHDEAQHEGKGNL